MELSVIQQAVARRVRTLGLAAGARILDAPCGGGGLVSTLRGAGFDAVGADIDVSAARRLGGAFTRADLAQPLPWPDATFDVVLSVEGIEHLENPFAYLRELHRVLIPGGTLVLTTPNIGSARSRVRFFGSGFFHQDPRPLREAARHPLHHVALMTFAELRYALRTSGFELLEAGHTHVKHASYLYVWMAPIAWIYTRVAFRKERDPAQREANVAIRRALVSPSLLLGENLLVVAKATRA
jgi:2-polyprenyl-3-methyl-5-hydroxy-6-metoxy-1,4-benzoquinol methylase